MNIVRISKTFMRPITSFQRYCSYKSTISTEFLYPGTTNQSKFANYDLGKLPTKDQTFSGYIPMKEIDFTYLLSSGPGGQNVQKNKTQVEIRFHLDSATWLSKEVKEIIKNKYSNQITKNGYIIVRSERTRSQLLNQADALQKLRHFIWTAVDEVRTYLERTQIDDVQKEKLIKAQERAARERVRSKRQHGQMRNFKRGIDQN